MQPLSLDQIVRISDDTVFRELNGEAVLLQLDAGMYYGLDPVATRLWQLLDEHRNLRAVFDAALAEFEVGAETLERDLLHLVSELVTRRLVTLG